MKYKDYYKIMGVDRGASSDEIKKAYRKLARKYHPDVSKEKNAEERFKEVNEAHEVLSDPEKRAAYDQLGRYQAGQDFRPPPDWQQRFTQGSFNFDDFADLFSSFAGRSGRGREPKPGQDYEVTAQISLEEAFAGTELALTLNLRESDGHGAVRSEPTTIKARIPKGATEGQRLRLTGKGGKGLNGGPNGNLYIDIRLLPHPLYRADGHDLYLDLPLAPWEAILGTTVEVPMPGGGSVRLKIPAGTRGGQQFRIAERGLPKPRGGAGHLFAVAQIVVPTAVGDKEAGLIKAWADASGFNPRPHFTA